MKPKHKRILFIFLALTSVSIGVYFLLSTFQNNIVFFVTPTEALDQNTHKTLRIGGVVRPKSLIKQQTTYQFDLIDKKSTISIQYHGMLPDLFKEGSTVVVQGNFTANKVFVAKEVLAKHDENYKPLEIQK